MKKRNSTLQGIKTENSHNHFTLRIRGAYIKLAVNVDAMSWAHDIYHKVVQFILGVCACLSSLDLLP